MVRHHDAAHVAQVIGKSPNWVKRHARSLPHSRAGQTYFWTDEDLAALLAYLRVRPAAADPGADDLRPFTGRRAS